jgi:hypothetical protein
MYFSSEVKIVDLFWKKTAAQKSFNIRERSLNIGKQIDCNAEYPYI